MNRRETFFFVGELVRFNPKPTTICPSLVDLMKNDLYMVAKYHPARYGPFKAYHGDDCDRSLCQCPMLRPIHQDVGYSVLSQKRNTFLYFDGSDLEPAP